VRRRVLIVVRRPVRRPATWVVDLFLDFRYACGTFTGVHGA
jgi:hypothetical protein